MADVGCRISDVPEAAASSDIRHPTSHIRHPTWTLVPVVAMGQGLGDVGVPAVLIGAALFAGVMLVILAMISRSIRRLLQAASRFAQGDLSQRVAVTGPLQVSELAEALNQMARQLQDRLETVVQQRNELGAVLSSMAEGVVAIDPEERILSLNRAAAAMLGVDAGQAIGRAIQEVVRNSAMQGFVARTLRDNAPVEGELTLHRSGAGPNTDRQLQVQSAILRDSEGRRIGAVIVLQDVTRLRRLEAVRRDFVANVSHEIRTPVSAVKAAVETLETLLAEQSADRADAQRFLKIVARQADRLAAIVEDLLSLARIEEASGRVRAELQPGSVAEAIRAACETCQANADAKRIRLQVRCDADLRARINAPLLEQALVNLVDNAVKYSPEDTQVTISGEPCGQEVVVAVRDEGRGIEPEHLPRIFERFYRTDSARSRALGGTGLGLSIVKHVAEAHGGRVSVDSTPGRGSTFRIHLLRVAE